MDPAARCTTTKSDPEKRRNAFRAKKLCLNCGLNNHQRAQCTSTRRCAVEGCNKAHHTSLHDYYANLAAANRRSGNRPQGQGPRGNQSQNQSQGNRGGGPARNNERQAGAESGRTMSTNSSPQSSGNSPASEGPEPARSTCANLSRGEKTVILGVLQGRLSPPGKPNRTIGGNIFLDSGSDTSYITRKTAESLGLPITSTSSIAIDTFGGNTEEGQFPKTQVRLSSPQGQALVDCLTAT